MNNPHFHVTARSAGADDDAHAGIGGVRWEAIFILLPPISRPPLHLPNYSTINLSPGIMGGGGGEDVACVDPIEVLQLRHNLQLFLLLLIVI